MVPMCTMNADGVRDQLYAEIIEGTPASCAAPAMPDTAGRR